MQYEGFVKSTHLTVFNFKSHFKSLQSAFMYGKGNRLRPTLGLDSLGTRSAQLGTRRRAVSLTR